MNEIVCHHFLYLDNEAKSGGSEEEGRKNEIVVDLFFLSFLVHDCHGATVFGIEFRDGSLL